MQSPLLPYLLTAVLLLLLPASIIRLLHTLPSFNRARPRPRKRGTPTHLMIVLGSGGHTAEMLSMLRDLDLRSYTHRSWVVSSRDRFSAQRGAEFEAELSAQSDDDDNDDRGGAVGGGGKGSGGFGGGAQDGENGRAWVTEGSVEGRQVRSGYSFHTLPRARQIHQSLLTSPFTCLQCLCSAVRMFLTHPAGYPDLILVNGPATSLIVILASLIVRFFAFLSMLPGWGRKGAGGKGREGGRMRSIYIESWARVKKPSLSGRIMVWGGLCDRVIVQWKGLEESGWGEYRGVLVR